MVIVNFKVEDAAEREQIRRDACEHYMTVGEYLRWLIAQERAKKREEDFLK